MLNYLFCTNSNLLYYVVLLRFFARLAKRYGGRLENGYAQACRGSSPLPGAFNFILIASFLFSKQLIQKLIIHIYDIL